MTKMLPGNNTGGSAAGGRRGYLLHAGVSAFAIGCLMAATPAMAQNSEGDPDTEIDSEPSPNEIVVTGIRASLSNSQNIKKNSDTVVDAITAEDIGALPDRSVTEALQRVPGVAINRFAGSSDPDHFSVEGSGVVIRGLNFVRSEFNGRDAFAAGVNGQSINFADIPAELLGSVIINKNSTADMIEGGLAGTVNLNTRKPFDRYGLQGGISIEANYGDFRKEWTPSVSGVLSNTWETDGGTFGLLVGGSYSQIKSRADGIQITNVQQRDGATVRLANDLESFVCRNRLPGNEDNFGRPPVDTCGQALPAGSDGFADLADQRFAPIGGQFRTQDFNRKRDGIVVAAQYETPDQGTVVTAQFIRAHSTNAWAERTFETAPDNSEYNTYPVGCVAENNGSGPGELSEGRVQCPIGGFENYVYDDNNLFQSGYITAPLAGWRGAGPNDGSTFIPAGGMQQSLSRREVFEEVTNTDYSINVRHEFTDRLTVEFDAQYATSKKDNDDVSVFGSTFADEELDLTGDYPVIIPRKPNQIAYAQTWAGGNADLAALTEDEYFRSTDVQFWRAAMDHFERSEGDQFALQADATYDFDDDSFVTQVKYGARYSDRDQTIRYTTYNWGALSEVWTGDDVVRFSQTPAENYDFYDFPDFFRGEVPGPPGAYYYNGDLIDNYDEAAARFIAIREQAEAKGADFGDQGWRPAAARADTVDGSYFRPDEISEIRQKDYAFYGMVKFETDDITESGIRIGGNAGIRFVRSEVSSASATRVPTASEAGIDDPFSVRCAPTLPPGVPPGTEAAVPGGVCALGPAGYAELQQFTGTTATIVPRTTESSYNYVLPSLNLRAEVTPEVIVRFAASKVLTRPQTSYIRNYLTFDLSQGTLLLSAGNPDLKPATAWQLDLTAEWYFAAVGSLTLNGFYKSVDGFFFQSPVPFNITNNGVTLESSLRAPANFDGTGEIKGFEIAYQQTYDFLPAPLDGLGMNANYSYIESSGLPNTFLNTGEPVDNSVTEPSGNLPLEGLSKHNFNVAVFYEKGPIQARAAYNWRSRFLLTVADAIYPFTSIFNEPTGQLDASLFVDITPNIKVGVQGVNLTNEVTETTQAYTGSADRLAPRSYFMNDRRFSFIIRGNF